MLLPYRYFVKLSYKGTKFHGWQVQENASTIQEELNQKLSVVLKQTISTLGAGRTDTGVHAKEMFAHFDCDIDLIPGKKDFLYHLNCNLDHDISVQDIFRVRKNANARFDAFARTYQYQITKVKNPFLKDFAWFVYGPLDVAKMNEGARMLLGKKDFGCFSKTHTQVKSNVCTIELAEWKEDGDVLVFTIKAERFLRNMVRAIVGTLIELGRNKITFADLEKIVEGKDRAEAGFSVPAKGLFLVKVEYPDNIFEIKSIE